jgi:NAD(P)-dependent dehydrogenase (short-subunit alcohol dehydrogenase family)
MKIRGNRSSRGNATHARSNSSGWQGRRRHRGCRRHRHRGDAAVGRTRRAYCRSRSQWSAAQNRDQGFAGSAQALAITADVTQEDEVAGYVRAAVDKFGTIDAFYNNAGIEGDIAPITRYSLETFRRVIDVNVVGVFLGLKHVLPVMLRQNKGSIINTASIAGLIGSPDIAVYSASKHAVIGLTKSAALECAATGVRVNCVCPGLIDSRMLSAIIEGRNPGNAPVPNDRIVERIPARRLGHASEVASVVAFLASDEASYVSGSAYTVDGGRVAT